MSSSGDLKGFQEAITLGGHEVLTLADITPNEDGILLVGINPSPPSVKVGHYYQGTLGKRLWARLRAVELLGDDDKWEDESWQRAGNGLTDIVKRPTASASELSKGEMAAGAETARSKLQVWRPRLILFSFLASAKALHGFAPPPGRGPAIDDISTFRMEGPYAASEQVDRNGRELWELAGGGSRRNLGNA